MAIITLISDWGLKDHYLASVKGLLLGRLPSLHIVDISHYIPPFDIEQAAYILKNCYRNFPAGTIHIIGVSSEESPVSPHTVVFHENQYFIGADTGIFSMIFDVKPERVIELDITQETDFFTFPTRDRFVKAAVHLVNGGTLEELGPDKGDVMRKLLFEPVPHEKKIIGLVIYIDTYQNLVTNIRRSKFNEIGKGRRFEIKIRNEKITKLSTSYSDAKINDLLAVFGSNNLLEIAIREGNAAGLLGMDYKDQVTIEFFDPE